MTTTLDQAWAAEVLTDVASALSAERERFQCPGVIYVLISEEGPPRIKIGWAGDESRRLHMLRASSPVLLRTVTSWPALQREEMAIHRRLAQHRHHNEWYRIEALYDLPKVICEVDKQLKEEALPV